MYESHYGFTGSPFQLNPDPAFYFNSRGHGRALAYLQYGVSQGEGFIVITGEIGAGKTTLVRTLLDGLDRQKVLAAQIVSTQLESGELLQSIITAFGVPAQGNTKAHLIATLEAFLTALAAQGRHALLIVDEAQNLSMKAVEELRMLSNFQLGNHSLLQSFLVGQPELRRLLQSAEMEQLRQRVTASCHLGPLSLDETRSYIEHRLTRVGWDGRPAFVPGAMEQIYRWSAGIPRRINRLANRLLLASFLDGSEKITPELVEQTAQELRVEIGEGDFEPLNLTVDQAAQTPAPSVVAAPERVESPTELASNDPSSPNDVEVAASGERVPAPSVEQVSEAQRDAAQVIEIDRSAARELLAGETSVAQVSRQLLETRPVDDRDSAAQDVVRIEKSVARRRRDVILCVADTASGALKFAALAQAMETGVDSPRMVLVNPGLDAWVWPWEKMERLLPSLEVGLHLGATSAALGSGSAVVFERFGHVLAEFSPQAVLTLGSGDGVLACAMLARQQGVDVVRLDGGDRSPRREGIARLANNASMLEQVSDLVFAVHHPGALTCLATEGVSSARVLAVPSLLEADAVSTVWTEATTPSGAFMRHGMPIYLGPAWSKHEISGTPYGVIAVSFRPGEEARAAQFCEVLTQVQALPKLVWVLDRITRAVLSEVLRRHPNLAESLCLILGEGPRDAAMKARMDQSVVLCREIPSLPEQLSILRGAQCAVVEPGQVLADAAELLDLPYVHLGDGQLSLRNRTQGVLAEFPLDAPNLNDCLSQLSALAPGAGHEVQVQHPTGATLMVAKHLKAWMARRRLESGTASDDESAEEPALTGVQQPSPLAA